MEKITTERIHYWDNVKAVLIFLVILGHLLIPLQPLAGKAIHALFDFIYLFHMPAFVFTTGLFAKIITDGKRLTNRLTGIMLVYLLFVLLVWCVDSYANHTCNFPVLFSVKSAPWYLLALFNWTIILQFLSEYKPCMILIASVIMGLYIGMESGAGSFFALSRTFVFLPFFMVGFYYDNKHVPRIKPFVRIAAGMVLIGIGIFLFVNNSELFKTYYPIVYGDKSYQEMGFSVVEGIVVRLAWYVVAALMTFCFLCIIPRIKTIFTYIGSRTLGIYICHRLITGSIKITGIYGFCAQLSGWENGILLSSLAILILMICSIKPITSFFNYLIKKEYI